MKKKVAVILSVYYSDHLEHLKCAINSIMLQTHNEVYLFIYRDGIVSAATDEYLHCIKSKHEKITLIVSENNLGLAHALNTLIDLVISKGSFSYIARMDSDDISRPERLQRQVHFFEKNVDIDVCGTSCREFGASFALKDKHLPKTHEQLIDFSIGRCPFIHPSVMFRAKVFNSGVRYPKNTALTEDMALWFILLNKGFRFSNLNEILIDYRLNEDTVSRRAGWGKAWSEFSIRFSNMLTLNRISINNIILVFARLVFHLLPISLLKIAYRKFR